MLIVDKKRFIAFCSILTVVAVGFFGFLGYYFWNMQTNSLTLENNLKNFAKAGEEAVKDLKNMPAMRIEKQDDKFVMTDDTNDGISIKYNKENGEQAEENEKKAENKFQINFPADYQKPIEVKLDAERTITILDNSKDKAKTELLSNQETIAGGQETKTEEQKKYLSYKTNRKKIIYAYQKDQATGEKKLKNWILYSKGSGEEKESYTLQNAKIKKNAEGEIEVFFFGQKEMQSQQAAAEVAPSLLERAQRTLAKEMGEDILNSDSPDFVIPKPYFLDKNGNRTDLEWTVGEDNISISIDISIDAKLYPLALDPTLSFTAPGQSNSGNAITGETGSFFGVSMTAGDFNADGKTDLAIGAEGYSSYAGRAYVFYNGSITTEAVTGADVIITGEAVSYFGHSVTSGDFNADGKTDLAIAGYRSSSDAGRVYIFYNDGSIPTTAASADVIITGETSSYLGSSMTSGDFNADGKVDLAIGAREYSSPVGRAYVFYNGAITTKNASGADVIITGEGQSSCYYFGSSMTSGDFNADGKIDLAIGAAAAGAGRAYVFYNGSITTENASGADAIITGESSSAFGTSMISGDFNSDGKIDLAISGPSYASTFFADEGRVYIFYNGAITTENASGADVIITGETSSKLGESMASGDFNADGKTDLAAGSKYLYRSYIFYNDGSIPTTAATADVVITSETSLDAGISMVSGDFNADGKTDLAVGYGGYSSNTGRVYIFYSQNGQVNTNFKITGEAGSQLGSSMVSGDFNADGEIDLAVGATAYSTNTGRVYIFYNDGSIPITAASADVTISGNTTNNYFGASMAAGDFNADGEVDLAVGAYGVSTSVGAAYIFYNDGSYPSTASSAEITIGGVAGNYFGCSMAAGDFNANGTTDLAVGGYTYSSNQGRAYVFLNDGSIPTLASSADAIITGVNSTGFGAKMTSGDLNGDGKMDLVVGEMIANAVFKVYVFYNGAITTKNASGADAIMTGSNTGIWGFVSMTTGDFNADGKTDLAVGETIVSSSAGAAYIFYNGAITTENFSGADVTITGEASSGFGKSMTAGDFNADGRVDLAVGASDYSSSAGRAYIFYNDSSIPTTAATADIIIAGDASSRFGSSVISGDFNADGRTDLAVGASAYSSSAGQVYIYETRENYAWQLQPQKSVRVSPISGQEMKITGEAGTSFGYSMVSGDLNADGKIDLAVGAYGYSSYSGRTYVFYNDGSIPSSASSGADAMITGENNNYYFGYSMTKGDFNNDGKIDLVVGSKPSSAAGRAYIFYNDGTYPESASSADHIITGSSGDSFGVSMISGDFNADGTTDLAVAARTGITDTGWVYIFYNDVSIPTTAGTADAIITGDAFTGFGYSLGAGDFNVDGKIDLAASSTGKVYIFYNGSITTENATGADVIISNFFSQIPFVIAGDFNSDGKNDLAVGDPSTSNSSVFIFYGGSIITEMASGADVNIQTGANAVYFGCSMTAGDFNADGRTDLAIGAYGYSSNIGRAYIFYNDGSISTPDVTITGETGSYLGWSMTAGDFNADGETDLAVGGYQYDVGSNTNEGRAYIYTFNDPNFTGDASSGLGISMVSGDFNADGKTDLVVGANTYSSGAGRAYVFFNDGVIPSTVATADAIITGEASSNFGFSFTAGDFNADGKVDLAIGAVTYSTSTGRAYIFYNGSIITESATGADVIISGQSSSFFGNAMVSGDFNDDGKTDLAVGAYLYSTSAGRAYIFYNGSIITENASDADIIITGEAISNFGVSMTSGDFNADGKIDLAIGAYNYDVGSATNEGRAYIFYNGAITTENASDADVIITGEAGSYFGVSMTSGDFNADGETDLAIGANNYSSSAGRAYIFHNDGSIPTTAATADAIITGEASSEFGSCMTSGDFNSDGKTDLTVGAYMYSSGAGRAYIFYNDNSYPANASSADQIFSGEATNNYFGDPIAIGDFNLDGKIDLAVGASGYSSSAGRFYVYTIESKNYPEVKSRLRGTGTYRGTVKVR